MDYIDSLLERQKSNQRYEGSYKVNPSCGEFLCPTCRRICNVIVPVPITNHKRQHIAQTYGGFVKNTAIEKTGNSLSSMLYVPQSVQDVLQICHEGYVTMKSIGVTPVIQARCQVKNIIKV